jgi:hypothetical protein
MMKDTVEDFRKAMVSVKVDVVVVGISVVMVDLSRE